MNTHRELSISIEPYINWFKLQRIPRHKISYLEFGDPNNNNVIICAHGLTRNAHDFDKLAKALTHSFRVIAINYPGRGDSDYFDNKWHYNYHVYTKDTLLFLKKLSIKNPIWLGTSMGGLIGMILASKYQKIFKGMILNDIGPHMPISTISRIEKYARQTILFDNLNDAKKHLKMIYSQFGINTEEDWDYITKHSFILNKSGKYQMNYDSSVVNGVKTNSKSKDINIWSIWHKILCPLLVIHGAKSDILLQSTIDKMKKTKNFDLYTVNEAGHAPALLGLDQIEAVNKWLNKVTLG